MRTSSRFWLRRSSPPGRRRAGSLLAISALVALVVAQGPSPDANLASTGRVVQGVAELDATPVTFPGPTWSASVGPIALSSPTVAEIDGVDAVVFASEDGDLYVVNADTGANLPGWPEPVTLSGGAPTAVESSPTVAYLDGPSNPPTIIVGAGSTYVRNQQGGLVAFRADGSVLFTFHTRDTFNEWTGSSTPGPDGFDDGVFATPAVGDITGSGQQDIVFGSYDHELYALTPQGNLVPGFPIDTQDTVWSSPALFHVRGKASQVDIFTGGDASGRLGCYGGFLYDITYASHRPRIVWQRCKNQTIWSSPAVGIINASGRAAVVVGTGFGERPPYKSDTDELFAYYAKNGARVPGWPVATAGPTFGSPAIGPLGTNGAADVVDTSWCMKCGSSPGSSMVYAWNGTGTLLWSQTLPGEKDFASPILVDLTGSGANDVIVGSSAGLFPLSGGTGAFLYGTSAASGINTCSEQTTPSVVDIPGTDTGAGWHLFETCGGPVELIATGRLFDYPLPVAPAVTPAWPMWRGDVAHDGKSS